MRKSSTKDLTIVAYGFDRLGFGTPGQPIRLGETARAEFIPFRDNRSLDKADGVIIPQGVFESIKTGYAGHVYTEVTVDWDLLYARERQVNNLEKDGKWVCFLVGQVVDEVPQQYQHERIEDTDLCKRILNNYDVRRHLVEGLSPLQVQDNAFAEYVRNYGVANTTFEVSYLHREDSRVLVKGAGRVVGVEFGGLVFFLPFHTTSRGPEALKLLVQTLASAISDYRQKRVKEIADWADSFQFKAEVDLGADISPLVSRLDDLQSELQSWRDYKLILTTSGDILKDELVKILRGYFQLKVDPIEQYREDAKVLDESGNVLALVEFKGVKRGIQRQDINQVDNHRDTSKMDASVPGVLLINNQMSVAGIDERSQTTVPDDQIERAKKSNVLIIRTIDLLFLMRHLEESHARKREFMKLVKSGGGWLRADTEGYTVVQDRAPKPE